MSNALHTSCVLYPSFASNASNTPNALYGSNVTNVVRLLTYASINSLYVKPTSSGCVEGIIVDMWQRVAQQLSLVSRIRILPMLPAPDQDAVPWQDLLDSLEDGSADVVLHHITPAMNLEVTLGGKNTVKENFISGLF